ncbi:hypothetical protein CYMTET_57012 [Cymbomonas tetramitiformis]|uniref:Uncharacterized protein n=1 Tax=Cymbomonas tetramitiformis TaxID=36881 RepID=A0AAE0ELR0_9CHLO|nr:hypothetical protein CYMTET_57012 [Cymbomonas tetramitiformis]
MQTEGATREESSTSQRPHYTGSKEDDREEFCLVFSRSATDEDDDGEVSDEYLRDGNSLTGLTGCDGKESTMHYWALRKFVHELDKRIKPFRDRVNENLRAQFPAGKGNLKLKDLENIVRVQDKIKDEVEEWSLSIVQGLLRRQTCPYSVYEPKKFGIDLNAVVTAIRAAEAKKITAKKKPSEAKQPSSPEGGGTGEPSITEADMNKQFAALAKEIKDKLAQDMDDIKGEMVLEE